MLLLESVMKNKEYEEIKEHFLKQNQKIKTFMTLVNSTGIKLMMVTVL